MEPNASPSMNPMPASGSGRGKMVAMWVVIVLVVLGVIWWWMSMKQASPATTQAPGTTQTASQSQQSAAAADNSDAAIAKSMANADAQLNGLSSDSATIDQGLTDQPVPQQAL